MKEKKHDAVSENSNLNDIKKIRELIEKCDDLKIAIKKDSKLLERFKLVRNLKIFGSVLNFLTPVCIVGTIITSGFYFLDAGLPFVKDEERKYKKYSYESGDGEVTLKESYEGGIGRNIDYGITDFFIFSTWGESGNNYERTIRHYTEKELTNVELYNAVKDNNIDYIYANYNYVDEEKEFFSYLSEEEKNENIKIEGVLTCIDKNDYLLILESDEKNNIATFGVLGLTLFAGIYAIKLRKYNLKSRISEHNKACEDLKNIIDKNKEELRSNRKKIKSLDRSVRKHEK